MIESLCTCGQPFSLPESSAGTTYVCADCQANVHVVCAESLPDGSGTGDFDARLVVEKGPHGDRVGDVYAVGGVAPIHLGKLAASHVLLPGSNVSRHHATLTRLDFGPSRWQIDDNRSTNGLWINDDRVTESHELQDGDLIVIGEYELRYQHSADPEPVATASLAAAAVGRPASMAGNAFGHVNGRSCPSCSKALPTNAKVCTDCGIYIDTGKPLITSKGFDENDLYIKADNTIRLLSFIFRIGLYPIASEGFGTQKPYVLWGFVIFTIFTSIIGFIANVSSEPNELPGTSSYMLWAGDPNLKPEIPHIDTERLSPSRRAAIEKLLEQVSERPHDTFHPYQLLTHAFLHAGIMHLAGNLIFMIVLGVSVNTLVGNGKLVIIYPLLAIAGGVGHFLASRHDPIHPMVGASGAIMGLAGMYLVLFPVHKVYMAFWMRLGILTGFKRWTKIWPVRGFWVVLFYISFDVAFTAFGVHDHTAHWAHLGGFMAGIVIALGLLLTRLVNAHGGDILSVTLGRHAWALLGKPSARAAAASPAAAVPAPAVVAPAVAVTSLDFPE